MNKFLLLIVATVSGQAQLIDIQPPTVTPPQVTPPAITPPAISPAGGNALVPGVPQPAQPPAPGAAAETAAQGGAAAGSQVPLPVFDPTSETITWNGHTWSVTNNRLFRARFERYLAAPEAELAQDLAYRQILQEINDAINPAKTAGRPALPRAVALLPRASQFPIDAKLSDALAEAIYSVWLARRSNYELNATNKEIESEVARLRRNFDVATDYSDLHAEKKPAGRSDAAQGQSGTPGQPGQNVNIDITPGTTPGSSGEQKAAENVRPLIEQYSGKAGAVGGYVQRMAELEARRAANMARQEISEVQAKVQFQTLLLQFLIQRRFEHVVMASRIYRVLFTDGDTNIHVEKGSEIDKVLSRGLGFNPTISNLDAAANEAIREVDEALQAFEFLADRGDLDSASKRLSEAFLVGEYLSRVRTLPRSQKVKVLDFVRDSNQLLSAIEVKDYTLAEELVGKLRGTAKDFDASKAAAAIETARTVAGMHINRARVAATQGDTATVSEELRQATQIWPNNPDLKTVSGMIFNRGDLQAQALVDFDALLGQRNYRQIYLDQAKYIAACADKPEYQEKLRPVLEQMNKVQMVLVQSEKLSETGDKFGAWEAVETVRKEFPHDPEISNRRAQLSAEASELASALARAESHEQQKQVGSSLAWYLKARKVYPHSQVARAGIERLAAQVIP